MQVYVICDNHPPGVSICILQVNCWGVVCLRTFVAIVIFGNLIFLDWFPSKKGGVSVYRRRERCLFVYLVVTQIQERSF